MAVHHVVWIKFRADVGAARIGEHLGALRDLATRIPGITSLSVGANFTNRSGGSTHGLVVELADRNALERYAAHPVHVAVATALCADAELMALDFES